MKQANNNPNGLWFGFLMTCICLLGCSLLGIGATLLFLKNINTTPIIYALISVAGISIVGCIAAGCIMVQNNNHQEQTLAAQARNIQKLFDEDNISRAKLRADATITQAVVQEAIVDTEALNRDLRRDLPQTGHVTLPSQMLFAQTIAGREGRVYTNGSEPTSIEEAVIVIAEGMSTNAQQINERDGLLSQLERQAQQGPR